MNTRITRSIEWINCLLQKRSPQPANRLRPRRSRGTPHTLRYCGSVTCKSSSVVFRLSLSLSLSLSFSFSISLYLSLSPRHQRPKNWRRRSGQWCATLFPPHGAVVEFVQNCNDFFYQEVTTTIIIDRQSIDPRIDR